MAQGVQMLGFNYYKTKAYNQFSYSNTDFLDKSVKKLFSYAYQQSLLELKTQAKKSAIQAGQHIGSFNHEFAKIEPQRRLTRQAFEKKRDLLQNDIKRSPFLPALFHFCENMQTVLDGFFQILSAFLQNHPNLEALLQNGVLDSEAILTVQKKVKAIKKKLLSYEESAQAPWKLHLHHLFKEAAHIDACLWQLKHMAECQKHFNHAVLKSTYREEEYKLWLAKTFKEAKLHYKEKKIPNVFFKMPKPKFNLAPIVYQDILRIEKSL